MENKLNFKELYDISEQKKKDDHDEFWRELKEISKKIEESGLPPELFKPIKVIEPVIPKKVVAKKVVNKPTSQEIRKEKERKEEWNSIVKYFLYFILWLFVCAMTKAGVQSLGFNAGRNFAELAGFLIGTPITGALIIFVTITFNSLKN